MVGPATENDRSPSFVLFEDSGNQCRQMNEDVDVKGYYGGDDDIAKVSRTLIGMDVEHCEHDYTESENELEASEDRLEQRQHGSVDP